ncbi:hypothetical protein K788_0004995 (plasmid) [Paraburkholderia caribensis MBA4]|uniref:Uncharacterized protein n=1 Tax=Paraburkholderia caribensis MBA4 TaxID=1323664 RepID=A0A0P0RKZ6_9BURK|nr:hypothetical protein K788_0004995 [Paraburkholderia caribensis MBA4]
MPHDSGPFKHGAGCVRAERRPSKRYGAPPCRSRKRTRPASDARRF